MKVKSLSHVRLLATPWTVAYKAPLSMGFFRQDYWSGLPFPSPGEYTQMCSEVYFSFNNFKSIDLDRSSRKWTATVLALVLI